MLLAPDFNVKSPCLHRVGENVVAQGVEGRGELRERVRHRSATVARACLWSPAMFSLDQLRIFTEPQQGATYDDLLAVAQRAEQLGFDAFFRSDHYLAMGAVLDAGGLPGPTDAWIDARRPRP